MATGALRFDAFALTSAQAARQRGHCSRAASRRCGRPAARPVRQDVKRAARPAKGAEDVHDMSRLGCSKGEQKRRNECAMSPLGLPEVLVVASVLVLAPLRQLIRASFVAKYIRSSVEH